MSYDYGLPTYHSPDLNKVNLARYYRLHAVDRSSPVCMGESLALAAV